MKSSPPRRLLPGRDIRVCSLLQTRGWSPGDRERSSRQLRREGGPERSASHQARGVQWKMEISCTFFGEPFDCSVRAGLRQISTVSTNSESEEQPKHHNQSALPTSAKPSASKGTGQREEPGAALRAQIPK